MALQGPAAGRQEAVGPLRRRHVLGERRLVAHARLRDGHRPDLLQPPRPRSRRASSARAPKRARSPTSCASKLLTLTGPRRRQRRSSAPSTSATTSIRARTCTNASELQVGMDDGYRVSWQTTLGGSPPGIVYKNDREVERRPRRLRLRDHVRRVRDAAVRSARSDPRIIDIAPTVLQLFRPADSDGHRWQAAFLIRRLRTHPAARSARCGASPRVDAGLAAQARCRRLAAARRSQTRAPSGSAALQREAEALAGAGAHAARSSCASSRSIAPIEVEQLAQIERDAADVRSEAGRGDGARRGARGRSGRGSGPTSRRASCSVYKMGRAGYWRLLLDVDRPARSRPRLSHGRARSDRIDRDRVEEHRRDARRRSATSAATLQARAKELDGSSASAREASAAVERARSPRAATLVASIDERRDLNAQLDRRAAGRAAQAAGDARRRWRRPRGARPRAPADPAVPGRAALAGRRRAARPGSAPGGRGAPARSSATASNSRCRKASPVHAGPRRDRSPLPTRSAATATLVIVDHGDRALLALRPSVSAVRPERGPRRGGRPRSGWPAATRPATRPSTSSCASTVSPWIPLQWLKRR